MEKTNISVILQLIDENGDSVTGKTTSDIINSVTNLHGINFLNELYSILKKELNTEKSTNNSAIKLYEPESFGPITSEFLPSKRVIPSWLPNHMKPLSS